MFERDAGRIQGKQIHVTFPRLELTFSPIEILFDEVQSLLINSDCIECNENLSLFLKLVVDYLKNETEIYHTCSLLALRLLNLNLFTKNFELCMGKILSLLTVLSAPLDDDKAERLKEFLLIFLLLLLKLQGDDEGAFSSAVDNDKLFSTLRLLGFVQVVGNFISYHIENSESTHSSYVLLKFNCDIIFQYLYHVVLLSDAEFESLTDSRLIPCLVTHLLANDNFNKYDVAGDFDDEDKLIAYEEFKLLLLINEQYLMKSMSCNSVQHKVFEGLLSKRKDSVNGMCGFTNLLVYHVNREESSIIKILMLKFLYLIFTTSYTARVPYINDLKILVDIIIRELNDLDYSAEAENRILALTYVKVLYPLLVYSELSESKPGYKIAEIVEMLRNVVTNCDTGCSDEDDASMNSAAVKTSQEITDIVKSAVKCLLIPWIKRSKPVAYNSVPGRLTKNANVSTDSISSASSLGSKLGALKLENEPASSSESLSFTRVASVRTSSRSDYHKHTTSHNLRDSPMEEKPNLFRANNNNVFLSPVTSPDCIPTRKTAELLDLPKEYLQNKSLPALPKDVSPSRESPSTSLKEKAKLKKAPPPPPPPSRKRR